MSPSQKDFPAKKGWDIIGSCHITLDTSDPLSLIANPQRGLRSKFPGPLQAKNITKTWLSKGPLQMLGTIAHAYNPSTWETEEA